MHILHVVGARPNFMKAAPVMRALANRAGIRQTLVHTGQHYDANMSDIFFRQLDLPQPDINLGVGSGSHTGQTAQIMLGLEEVFTAQQPDWVLVYGDVNSTLAAALVCAKLLIKIAHVEAGLRSGDRTMPEEVNRLLTDRVADLLLTPSQDGDENLLHEGVDPEKIHCVGNVMIDTLVRLLPRAHDVTFDDLPDRYALVTLHRPSNVDDPAMLRQIIETLAAISADIPVLFPVHPRTRQRIASFGIDLPDGGRFRLMEPVGYIEFLALQTRATLIITDSGGIQEESTFLGVPCLTVRENTERPVTVTLGTNVLVGQDMDQLRTHVAAVLAGQGRNGQIPPLWDGKAGERIAAILVPEAE
ncbi:MAG: UDP-N-acetylglucosamine 2-epimerase (non-hydrolyzing) [Anaerolineaceae bacterium]|nr:UDP-N-acetylglucosamine 2-epimerase (non-hydrolyzing) [Anaerolineaceae bacterium]